MKQAVQTLLGITALLMFVAVVAQANSELTTINETIEAGRRMLNTEQHDKGKQLINNAMVELEELCNQNPTNVAAICQLSMNYFYLENDKEAIKNFERMARIAPEDARPHFFTGLIYRYGNQMDKSEAAFIRACELEPKEERNWYELGVLYYNTDKPKKAITAFEATININAQHMKANYKLALCYWENSQQTNAVSMLKKVTHSEPDNINAFYNLGQFSQTLGNTEDALNAFERVVELDPSDWRALAKTMQLNQALGRLKQRDEIRKKIHALKKEAKLESLNKELLFCRDQFAAGDENIMVFEYFEMSGERAIRYSFVVLGENGKDKKYRITLGSYDSSNSIAEELGDVKKGQRLFHLDGYYPDGSHRTFEFFRGEPDYDVVKAMVVDILKGEKESISSMTPTAPE